MGGVGTPILGRPRPLPGHRRADHYTLNCDEPRNPDLQPLSVRLPSLQATTDLGVLMAAPAISTLLPVVLFLLFQRMFLRGTGLDGAVKG